MKTGREDKDAQRIESGGNENGARYGSSTDEGQCMCHTRQQNRVGEINSPDSLSHPPSMPPADER